MVWIYSVLSGFEWGFIGWFLVRNTYWNHVAWVGFVTSPAIGLAMGAVAVLFHRLPWWGRAILSLINLYIAAVMFALALGIGDVVWGAAPAATIPAPRPDAVTVVATDPGPRVVAMARILSPVFNVLVGLTIRGDILVLWPLSHANHLLIWYLRDDAQSAG
jgi:hypothetical protein